MVEAMMQWRDTLLKLSDNHFFDLMRLYLGEIKTPFNKQKLLESLSGFFRNQTNKKIIIDLLDADDILILAALIHITNITSEKLAAFFSGTFKSFVLNEKLLQLEERMLIYRFKKIIHGISHTVFALNPFLAEDIEARASKNDLVISQHYIVDEKEYAEKMIVCNPAYIAALISFFAHTDDIFKRDGTFKKKAESICQETGLYKSDHQKECFSTLTEALISCDVLIKKETRLIIQHKNLEALSTLSPKDICAYLTICATGRFSPRTIHSEAQMLLQLLFSMEKNRAYTEAHIQRLAFLCRDTAYNNTDNKRKACIKGGRFASMLQENQGNAAGESCSTTVLIQQAVLFNLICKKDDLFFKNPAFDEALQEHSDALTLHIDATNRITVLMRNPLHVVLSDMLPIALCAEIKKADTVYQFELTRSSCMDSFQLQYTPESISSFLTNIANITLPQHISFSLGEWYNAFLSVQLYFGYVLKVAESKAVYIENNEHIKKHIKTILAPGIYILAFSSNEEAHTLLNNSGLDFIYGLQLHDENKESSRTLVHFVPLSATALSQQIHIETNQQQSNELQSEFETQHKELLYNALSKMQLTAEADAELRSRIARKVIIKSEQLTTSSLRLEKIEASGMDFLGKVRIAQSALNTHSLLELCYEEAGIKKTIGAYPLKLEKTTSDALLYIRNEADDDEIIMSLSKVNSIKRIRTSLFSD